MNDLLQGEKYLWLLPKSADQTTLDIAATYNLSMPIAQTLANRGMTDNEQIRLFLFSSQEDVTHASVLKDAEKAVDRLLKAIIDKEKILIFGDYDVDGITSSSMIMSCLLPLGAQINFFLPNRVRDGYGLSTRIVERAATSGYKLIVTVDNGITAFEPAQRAKELGIDLIITDHHKQHETLPDALAIVNPNRTDCAYPCKGLAGVGVTFKLMSLLYERKGLQLPAKVYELLLLGTVADVVPLVGENRFWVRHGLNHINKTESFALKVLKQNGRVTKPKISSLDIGFSIAPQINALGRLEDPRDGVKFLIGSNAKDIESVGRVLFELNQARREVERSIVQEIETEIQQKRIDPEKENIIMAASDSWPSGVIGLVASRFVSGYGKPTMLFHLAKGGIAKGSCRSIPEFNMFQALQDAKHLLIQFGGHAHAAGLSLKVENLPTLKEHLEEAIAQQLTEFDLKQKVVLDADVSLSDLTKKFMNDIEFLEPFGNANEQPIFYIKNVTLMQKPTLLKDLHVKCQVFADGVIKPIIFFNRPDLFASLMAMEDNPFDVAARVTENYWNDRVTIELMGVDIARSKA